jgi:hypothetical protein
MPHRMFVALKGPPLVAGTDRIKTVAVLDKMKSGAVSTWRRSGRFVLVSVTRRERSRSRLELAASRCRSVGRFSLVRCPSSAAGSTDSWQESELLCDLSVRLGVEPTPRLATRCFPLEGARGAPFLTPCRLAKR